MYCFTGVCLKQFQTQGVKDQNQYLKFPDYILFLFHHDETETKQN